jgi:hypothetical protein
MPQNNQDKKIYYITEGDVYQIADDLDIPKEKITREVMENVAKALGEGLDNWSNIVEEALNKALNL